MGQKEKSSASFDYLVSRGEQRRRDGQAERSGGLQIDYQLKLSGLLYRQIARLGALQNLIHVGGAAAYHLRKAHPIGHQTPGIDPFPRPEYARQALLRSEVDDLF